MQKCDESPSGKLLQAIGEFNRGDWFECHETLEDLWVGEEGEVRYFYQGVLQVAVALHHWRGGNFGGAVSLLKSGADYLRRVSPVCRRVDVARLIAATDQLRETLSTLGPTRMSELDPVYIPVVRLARSLDEEEKKRK
jgi:predicted metal-dependent hydrolase